MNAELEFSASTLLKNIRQCSTTTSSLNPFNLRSENAIRAAPTASLRYSTHSGTAIGDEEEKAEGKRKNRMVAETFSHIEVARSDTRDGRPVNH